MSGKVHISVYVGTMENKDKLTQSAYPRFCWNHIYLVFWLAEHEYDYKSNANDNFKVKCIKNLNHRKMEEKKNKKGKKYLKKITKKEC